MDIGDRVQHKSGVTGKVVRINEWVYVCIDGTAMAVPFYASSLEVIEKEGEHGQQHCN